MVSFMVQSVQFVKPDATMATIAGTILAIAYVGLARQLHHPDALVRRLTSWHVATRAPDRDGQGGRHGRLHGGPARGPAQALAQAQPQQDDRGGHRWHDLRRGCAPLVRRDQLVPCSHVPTLGWLQTVGFGFVVGLAAQLGDLMESMIKRDCERKDASSAVPGFGGVLDVLDSLLFAGPVAYGLWLCTRTRKRIACGDCTCVL